MLVIKVYIIVSLDLIMFFGFTLLCLIQGQNVLPLFLPTDKKDNFKNIRIFICCVWVWPSDICYKQFKDNARKGIFLGYVFHTFLLILWYDRESEHIKISTH